MRVALLGSAAGHWQELRIVCEFMLSELEADRVFYLGQDGLLADMQKDWISELDAQPILAPDGSAWPKEGLSLWQQSIPCASAGPAELDAFVAIEQQKLQLERLSTVPDGGSYLLPLAESGHLLVRHNRNQFDDEELEKARFVGFGGRKNALIRQIGKKFFLDPGSFETAGAMLLNDSRQHLTVSLFDRTTKLVDRHRLTTTSSTIAPGQP